MRLSGWDDDRLFATDDSVASSQPIDDNVVIEESASTLAPGVASGGSGDAAGGIAPSEPAPGVASGGVASGQAAGEIAPSEPAPSGVPGELAPVLLPPTPVFRFYKGGNGIDQLRGVEPSGEPTAPEDWVGSATHSLGHEREGLASLPDGRLVRDAIDADPLGYLGPEHVARFGSSPALLVKLLDAGERLAVHFHPDREFAREYMGSAFGKTEAWIILAAEPGAHMDFGLREPISADTLSGWVQRQDSEEMLRALHQVPVAAGDVLFVPAGTLHTIGEGITLIELQEPSDMSVVLEWRRFNVTGGEEHLGFGWERILTAARTEPSEPMPGPVSDPAASGSRVESLLPPEAAPYFRAQRVIVSGPELELEPAFAVVIAVEGQLSITHDGGEPLTLSRGQAALVPHGAGVTTWSGSGTAVRCMPPAIDSGEEKQ